MTVGQHPAHRNAERKVFFSETVDWGKTLLNDRLYRHRFPAVSLCPRANAIPAKERIAAVTFSRGDLWRKGDKKRGKGENEERGKREWGMCKAIATGRTTN